MQRESWYDPGWGYRQYYVELLTLLAGAVRVPRVLNGCFPVHPPIPPAIPHIYCKFSPLPMGDVIDPNLPHIFSPSNNPDMISRMSSLCDSRVAIRTGLGPRLPLCSLHLVRIDPVAASNRPLAAMEPGDPSLRSSHITMSLSPAPAIATLLSTLAYRTRSRSSFP